MNILEAQQDMREAYVDGGTGVLVSGIVWLTAGLVAMIHTAQSSIIVFFIGGMFIFPLGILLSKLYKRSGQHQKDNPFGKLALESTAILFVGLFLAYSFYNSLPYLFYPIMLLIIGVRYLIFQTLYGLKVYWILGAALLSAGGLGVLSNQPFHLFALIGGGIELVFSLYILYESEK